MPSAEYQRAWVLAHPGKAGMYQRRFCERHREIVAARRAAAAKTESQRARVHAYYVNHKDKLRENGRRSEEKRAASGKRRTFNRVKMREAGRRYRERHLEIVRQRDREYKRRNPETRIRRRARLLGAEGSFSNSEWLGVCERQAHKCAGCGECKPLARDHVIPLSRGGTNYISNIQGLCKSCNSRKGARLMWPCGTQTETHGGITEG